MNKLPQLFWRPKVVGIMISIHIIAIFKNVMLVNFPGVQRSTHRVCHGSYTVDTYTKKLFWLFAT